MERDNRPKSGWLSLVFIGMFAVGFLILPTATALADNPSITLIANKNNYVIGQDSFTLKFDIKAGTENNSVDIYIAAQFPDNSFIFLNQQGQWTAQVVPFFTGWTVSDASSDQFGPLLEFQVPASIATGAYAFWGVFTQPDSTSWPFISYSAASFNFNKPFTSPSLIMAAHDPNSPSYNGDCIGCHGNRVSEVSLNPNIKPAHAVMLPEYPGGATVTNQTCQTCHSKGVDLRDESAASLWRNTDVAKCVACHAKGGVALPFYQ
jgi:hypothetical protein